MLLSTFPIEEGRLAPAEEVPGSSRAPDGGASPGGLPEEAEGAREAAALCRWASGGEPREGTATTIAQPRQPEGPEDRGRKGIRSRGLKHSTVGYM